jgi:tetratricopeptide (TPR) repeat protein
MSNLDVLMARKSKPISKVQAEKFRRFFPAFQTAVAAASLSPSAAEKTFRKRFSKAGSPEEKCLAHLGLGMALSSRAKYDEAAAHFRSALSLDPHMLPALLELGNTYRMAGQPRQAVSILEEAMERDENNRVALYLAGLSYQQMEEYEKSVKYFERLASIGTQKHEVFYQLGISYGRLERLAKAHYNFAKYFAALLQNEDAAFHFRKAEEFAKGNPVLLHRIQREMNRHGFRTK